MNIVSSFQHICYKESLQPGPGDRNISRGCKPKVECPAGAMTDIEPSLACENGKCLNCDYFNNDTDENKPWRRCDKPGVYLDMVELLVLQLENGFLHNLGAVLHTLFLHTITIGLNHHCWLEVKFESHDAKTIILWHYISIEQVGNNT